MQSASCKAGKAGFKWAAVVLASGPTSAIDLFGDVDKFISHWKNAYDANACHGGGGDGCGIKEPLISRPKTEGLPA